VLVQQTELPAHGHRPNRHWEQDVRFFPTSCSTSDGGAQRFFFPPWPRPLLPRGSPADRVAIVNISPQMGARPASPFAPGPRPRPPRRHWNSVKNKTPGPLGRQAFGAKRDSCQHRRAPGLPAPALAVRPSVNATGWSSWFPATPLGPDPLDPTRKKKNRRGESFFLPLPSRPPQGELRHPGPNRTGWTPAGLLKQNRPSDQTEQIGDRPGREQTVRATALFVKLRGNPYGAYGWTRGERRMRASFVLRHGKPHVVLTCGHVMSTPRGWPSWWSPRHDRQRAGSDKRHPSGAGPPTNYVRRTRAGPLTCFAPRDAHSIVATT